MTPMSRTRPPRNRMRATRKGHLMKRVAPVTCLVVLAVSTVAGCVSVQEDPAVDPMELVDREGEACSTTLEARSCPKEFGPGEVVSGVQFCGDIEGAHVWGECVVDPACDVADDICEDGREEYCLLEQGLPRAYSCQDDGDDCGIDGCDTPLVLAFGDATVEYREAMGARFDIAGTGRCDTHDWPTGATPWLVVDLDGNGDIDGGHELFGSGSILQSGMRASDGFAALAELDDDGDGIVSERDRRWAELMAWSDHDGDRHASADELEPLSTFGIGELPLRYERERRCDARGNCGVERAELSTASGLAHLIDVHLPCR